MRAVLAVALVATLAAAQAGFIRYSQCSDKLGCASRTCQSVDIPQDSCEAAGSNGTKSMFFDCIHEALLCARTTHFESTSCAEPGNAHGDLVCGYCYPQQDKPGTFLKVNCVYNGNDVPGVNMTECYDSKCGSCSRSAKFAIQAGTCYPAGSHPSNRTGTFRLNDFYPCSTVAFAQWNNPDCSGNEQGSTKILPTGQCIDGQKITCHKP